MGTRHVTRFSNLLLILAAAGGLLVAGCAVTETNVAPGTVAVEKTVVDERLANEDFAFPSKPPSLKDGKAIYEAQCAACHTASSWQSRDKQETLAYTTPIDFYLLLTTGEGPEAHLKTAERRGLMEGKTHQAFRQETTRDERWAVIFYTRYLAGAGDIEATSKDGKPLDVAAIYGANCAVCHGKRGYADGPLHTGHPSSHELSGAKIAGGLFLPPPANFHEYQRMYNRTDAQIFRYLVQGIYPSAMPAWYGNTDKDYNFDFDAPMLWKLVRHVRTFAYDNDLPSGDDAEPAPKSPELGLIVKPLVPAVPKAANESRPWDTPRAFQRLQRPIAPEGYPPISAGNLSTSGQVDKLMDTRSVKKTGHSR